MANVVVVFRGKNTSSIELDAIAAWPGEVVGVFVCAREGDPMRKKHDRSVEEVLAILNDFGGGVVVANGGGSDPAFALIMRLSEVNGEVRVYDVQRDQPPKLLGRSTSNLCACGCGQPGHTPLASRECAGRMSW